MLRLGGQLLKLANWWIESSYFGRALGRGVTKEGEGWKIRHQPDTSSEMELADKDPRKVNRVEDILTMDRPCRDTSGIFKEWIVVLNRKSALNWGPGQLPVQIPPGRH